jgi:hypothetical protein
MSLRDSRPTFAVFNSAIMFLIGLANLELPLSGEGRVLGGLSQHKRDEQLYFPSGGPGPLKKSRLIDSQIRSCASLRGTLSFARGQVCP